ANGGLSFHLSRRREHAGGATRRNVGVPRTATPVGERYRANGPQAPRAYRVGTFADCPARRSLLPHAAALRVPADAALDGAAAASVAAAAGVRRAHYVAHRSASVRRSDRVLGAVLRDGRVRAGPLDLVSDRQTAALDSDWRGARAPLDQGSVLGPDQHGRRVRTYAEAGWRCRPLPSGCPTAHRRDRSRAVELGQRGGFDRDRPLVCGAVC